MIYYEPVSALLCFCRGLKLWEYFVLRFSESVFPSLVFSLSLSCKPVSSLLFVCFVCMGVDVGETGPVCLMEVGWSKQVWSKKRKQRKKSPGPTSRYVSNKWFLCSVKKFNSRVVMEDHINRLEFEHTCYGLLESTSEEATVSMFHWSMH